MMDQPHLLLACNNGPYVWDRSQHLEGMGSTFQWRKPSLIAAHIIQGKWIGNLTNRHHKDEGDQSEYFGLSYSHCDAKSLQVYKKVNPNNFVYTTEQNMFNYIPAIPVVNTTVVVFEWEHLDQSNNFAVFDKTFRKRFHHQRLLRQTPKRTANEYWVSVHFRWGDVKTKDPNKPDGRNGLSFADYCLCINAMVLINPHIELFLFAEGLAKPESCWDLKLKNIHFFNDSISWKRDIDIMSQSQLLIGGRSSFFVLGSHLCENCTVIHNSPIKFKTSDYEKKLPIHLVEINCNMGLSCYLENIRKYKWHNIGGVNVK